MTLTEFLLARIAEDEAVARAAIEDDCAVPRRVLAECEAKRQIVALHYVGDPQDWDPEQWACRLCQWDEDCDSPKLDHQHGAGRFPCSTLRALAAVYADHEEYDPGWRALYRTEDV